MKKMMIVLLALATSSAMGAMPADSAGSENPNVNAKINRAERNQMERTTPASVPRVTNDAEIAKVLVNINETEMESAKYAARKANNAEVQAFAENMAKEHKENVKETKQIAKGLKGRLDKSNMSIDVRDNGKNRLHTLKKTKAANFDSIYVQQQIEMHQEALTLLNETLIPQAQDGNLKSHLLKTRDAVSMHLTEVQALQTRL